MKYRPTATPRFMSLWQRFAILNRTRTAGEWSWGNLPPDDPDRLFLEFITANADEIIAELEKSLCVLQ